MNNGAPVCLKCGLRSSQAVLVICPATATLFILPARSDKIIPAYIPGHDLRLAHGISIEGICAERIEKIAACPTAYCEVRQKHAVTCVCLDIITVAYDIAFDCP